jgi:hypothetical protein
MFSRKNRQMAEFCYFFLFLSPLKNLSASPFPSFAAFKYAKTTGLLGAVSVSPFQNL